MSGEGYSQFVTIDQYIQQWNQLTSIDGLELTPTTIAIATSKCNPNEKARLKQAMQQILAEGKSLAMKVAAVRLLATTQECTKDLFSLVGKDTPLPISLAVISSALLCQDIFLSVPALLGWLEEFNPLASTLPASIKYRSLAFACRIQLGQLLNNPEAERFYPLITEALQARRKRMDTTEEEYFMDRKKGTPVSGSESIAAVLKLPLDYVSECILQSTIDNIEHIRRTVNAGILWPKGKDVTTADKPVESKASTSRQLEQARAEEQPRKEKQVQVQRRKEPPVSHLLSALRRMLESSVIDETMPLVTAFVVSLPMDSEGHKELISWCIKAKNTPMAIRVLRSLWVSAQMANIQDTFYYDHILESFLKGFPEEVHLDICLEAPRLPFPLIEGRLALPQIETLALNRPGLRPALMDYLLANIDAEGVIATLVRLYERVKETRAAIEQAALEHQIGSLLVPLLGIQPRLLVHVLVGPELKDDNDYIPSNLPNSIATHATDRRIKRLASTIQANIRQTPPARIQKILVPIVNAVIKAHPGKDTLSQTILHCIMQDVGFDLHLILPVIGLVGREDLEGLLPRLVQLLENPEEQDFVRLVLFKLVDAGTISAMELFVHLHHLDTLLRPKTAIAALHLCFMNTAVFKPDVLADAMQQMLSEPKLPTLFMRTAIQSMAIHKNLQGFVVGLLGRLVSRSIWEDVTAWRGFIKAVSQLIPSALPVLVQLPSEHLRDLLTRSDASVKDSIKQYLWAQAPSVRRRFAPLLEALEQ